MQEKDAKKDNKSEKKTKGIKAAKASPAATPPVGATGPRKRVVAENGKILVVDSVGNVYLEQANEDGQSQEYLLDVCSSHPLSNIQLTRSSPMNSKDQQSKTQPSSVSHSGLSTASLESFYARRLLSPRTMKKKRKWSSPAALVLMISKSWRRSRRLRRMGQERQRRGARRLLVVGRCFEMGFFFVCRIRVTQTV